MFITYFYYLNSIFFLSVFFLLIEFSPKLKYIFKKINCLNLSNFSILIKHSKAMEAGLINCFENFHMNGGKFKTLSIPTFFYENTC